MVRNKKEDFVEMERGPGDKEEVGEWKGKLK